jgi:3-deoxy-manno-octulosonate cytidylyltransferase (CMP-KDO synthetase)
MKAVGVIPARYASTRFPGKILFPVAGKPLVQWVVERVKQAQSLDEVMLATDDQRIADAAADWDVKVVMTRADHPSGSDRMAEAAGHTDADVLVNIQGDEPLIEPRLIDELVAGIRDRGDFDMATAAVPIHLEREVLDPSVVKVVMGEGQRALYFSRAPIPHFRDEALKDALKHNLYFRHLGIYAYQKSFLQRYVAAPPSALEEAEKLEQLRALHIGCRMKVIVTEGVGPGIDEPEDVAKAEAAMRAAGIIS